MDESMFKGIVPTLLIVGGICGAAVYALLAWLLPHIAIGWR